jgi:hypothetical protein
MYRRMVIVGVMAMCFGAAAGPSAASTPAGPTLQGEEVLVEAVGITLTADCNTGGNSQVSWTASGPATGPFPGTFTASGTITIGPQTLPGFHPPSPKREGTIAGPVLGWSESFTIESGTTSITGTKSLLPTASVEGGTLGTCQQVSQFPILDFLDGQGRVVEVNAQTHYAATIDGPGLPTSDSGQALSSVSQLDITGSCPAGICQATIGGFSETFTVSDQTVPPSCGEEDAVHQDVSESEEEECDSD